MDFSTFSELFCKIFKQNHLESFCKAEIIQKFYDFTLLLVEENSHTNLTAIRDIPNIISKHYADCLLAEPHFPKNAIVMDIGCGGGFPTIPLAITRPDLRITAVDSTAKKIAFVQKAIQHLHLTNVTPICDRAESDSMRKYRESYDIVTSRAMARMCVLTELALPFAKKSGKLIALKGAQGTIELKEAEKAITTLGGSSTIEDVFFELAVDREVTEARHILIVSKISQTPKQYPRNYATITKKPII